MAKRQTKQNQKGTNLGKRETEVQKLRAMLAERDAELASIKKVLTPKQKARVQMQAANKLMSAQHKDMMRRDAAKLREFRKQVKELQKAGLVSAKYNVKDVRPTDTLRKLIAKNASVLTGESTAKKVTRKQADILRAKGYRVTNGTAILPSGSTVDKDGKVTEGKSRKRSLVFMDEVQFANAYKRNGWDKRKRTEVITVTYKGKKLDNMGHPTDLQEILQFVNRYSSRKDLLDGLGFSITDLNKNYRETDDD